MPGPFEVTFFYKSWEDGGCDAWVGRYYNPRGQWFAVWHTGTPKSSWWRARRWTLRAWYFWPNDDVPHTQLSAEEQRHLPP